MNASKPHIGSSFRLHGLLLLVWLALAGVSIFFAVHRDLSLARMAFTESADRVFDRVQDRVRLSQAVMDGFVAVLEAASGEDVAIASEYASSVLARYPMVYAIEVVQRVPHAALESVGELRTHPPVQSMWVKTFGYGSDRKWSPVPEKPFYYPIVFLEPPLPAALDVIGLDVDSVALLRRALRESSRIMAAVASESFNLVEGPKAIATFAPIGAVEHPREDHPYRFERFAEMILKVDALLGTGEELVPEAELSLHLRGFEGEAAPHELILRGDAGGASAAIFPRLDFERRVEALSRTFVLRAVKQTGWHDVNRGQLSLIAGLSVVTFAFLVWFSRLHHRRELLRLRHEERLFDMANFDAVTGLANRHLCTDRLEREVEVAKRRAQRFAVLFVDVDDFKSVNDRYGHNVGDAVLRATGERLARCVRSSDWVARLSGDEFLITLTTPSGEDVAALIREKVHDSFAAPIALAEATVPVCVSIGVAVYPHDGGDLEALTRAADTAMYEAKIARRKAG
jgi:diguanylate cyclase (GGDEF)-like protein